FGCWLGFLFGESTGLVGKTHPARFQYCSGSANRNYAMILLGIFAAILTIFAAGLGVTVSIFARTGRINLVECCCLSWLLGSGIVSLLLWLCGTSCSGLTLQAVVTVACLALAIFGWRAKRHAAAQFTFPTPTN